MSPITNWSAVAWPQFHRFANHNPFERITEAFLNHSSKLRFQLAFGGNEMPYWSVTQSFQLDSVRWFCICLDLDSLMLIAVNSPVAQELFKKSGKLDGLSLALNWLFPVQKSSSSYATGLIWDSKITICKVHPLQTSVCSHEPWKPLNKAQSHSGSLPKALGPRKAWETLGTLLWPSTTQAK